MFATGSSRFIFVRRCLEKENISPRPRGKDANAKNNGVEYAWIYDGVQSDKRHGESQQKPPS